MAFVAFVLGALAGMLWALACGYGRARRRRVDETLLRRYLSWKRELAARALAAMSS